MIAFALLRLIQDTIWIFAKMFLERASIFYPEVETTNIYYGGTKIAGSKIVFSNGSQDPWRHASKQTSSPDVPSYIITCHNCGHGTDLRGCPQSPLSFEGNAQNCSSPDAVHKVVRNGRQRK